MESHKCASNEEILKLLHNLTREVSQVKTDCQRIKKEVLGISDESELEPEGLLESSTIRQVMEKMAFDIEQLKVTAEEDRRRQSEEGKESIAELTNVVQEEFTKQRNDSEQTKELIIADIKSVVQEESNKTEKRELMFKLKGIEPRTMEEEKMRLRTEVDTICRGRQMALMADGPISSQELLAKTFLMGLKFGPVLETKIRNFLDVPVSNLKLGTERCQPNIGTSGLSIPARSKQGLTFASSGPMTWFSVLMSFQVERSNLWLITYASVSSIDQVSIRSAFTNSSVELNEQMRQNFARLPKDANPICLGGENVAICANNFNGGEFFIKSGNIRARTKLISTTTAPGNTLLLTVDIVCVQGMERPPSSIPSMQSLQALNRISRIIRPSETLRKDTLDSIPPECGALVILGNGLSTELKNPLVQIRYGEQWTNENAIPSFSSDCYPIYSRSSQRNDYRALEAVISFQIPDTDLSLALAFRVDPRENGNTFGVGFVSTCHVETTDLFGILVEENNYWSWAIPHILRGTRDDLKIAKKAEDGEQVIYRRNILARACMTMTNEKTAVLELFLTTF